MRFARFFLIITLSAIPLAAQPFALAPPSIGATPGEVKGAVASSNGSIYLMVWTEVRQGIAQVRGIHVNFDGVPVEASSFPISPAAEAAVSADVSAPAVANDGEDFMVVWSVNSKLHTAIVPAAGSIHVTATNVDATTVFVVWSGNAYVVLHRTSLGTLAATLVDFLSGDTLQNGTPVSTSPSVESPALTVNNAGHALAFWIGDGQLHLADVSTAHVTSGTITSTVLPSPQQVHATAMIGSDGLGFLALWDAYPATPQANEFSIFARPLDSNGAPAGPAQLVTAADRSLSHPVLFWNGQYWLLINSDPSAGLTVHPLDANGFPAPVSPYAITTHSASAKEAVALLAGGTTNGQVNDFVLWRDLGYEHPELVGEVTDGNGRPTSGEIFVSLAPADQMAAAAVWTGADYLAVWTEKAGNSRIVASRANERVPIVIGTGQFTSGTPGNPAVAAAGGKAVVVWIDAGATPFQQTAIYRTTLANGAHTAPLASLMSSDVRNEAPSIATNGQTFAVVWTTRQGEIAGMTMDAAGNASNTTVLLTSKPSDTFTYGSPRLAWAGNTYVLARLRTLNDGRTLLELQLLNADLTLGLGPWILANEDSPASVSLAGSPTGALVTWIQHLGSEPSVRAARFTSQLPGDPPRGPATIIDPVNGTPVITAEPVHKLVAGWDGSNWRIGVDNTLITLPPSGSSAQLMVKIPAATRIAAIAGGGPRLFVAFDADDPVERISRVYGQFVSDTVLRHRPVRAR